MALTGRVGLAALAGAAVVALLVPSTAGVLVVTTVLVLAVGVDIALAGSVRDLRLRRRGDTAVRLGERATVTTEIANSGRRRVRGTLRDAWQPSAGAVTERHAVDVAPGAVTAVSTELEPTRRGDRLAARITVRARGPLGLAARQASHEVPWTLRALPPFSARKHLPARLSRLQLLDGRQAVLTRGQGTEFDSLREYVIGDDVRSIDWRATARTADVMVRTWRPERDRRIVIVLDTSRTSAGRVDDAPRLDAAMDAALLLSALASRAGDQVDLLAYDRTVRAAVTGVGHGQLLTALVNAMAPVQPELVEFDARGMAAEVLRRARGRSLLVLLTGLEPAPLQQGLLPVLPRLITRHRLLLAGIADPQVARMARGRGSAPEVYAAAAAERALAERRQVIDRFRTQGVSVVDAGPDELPPALADRYLALKSAGQLS